MSNLLQDLRYGFRLLAKNPAFAALAVLTLALGIGLTTTMFSIVYAAMLRGLPFEDAHEIVAVARTNPERGIDRMGVSLHDLEEWRAQQQAFTELAGYYTGTVNLSGTERAERYDGAFVTANTLRLLGAQPALGRHFRDGEDQPGAEPTLLLSHAVWRDRYGSDPQILGKTVRANGEEMTVIGVMPEGFHFPANEMMWIALRQSATQLKRGEGQTMDVMGRLRDGVSLDQAQVQMSAIASRLAREYPDTNGELGAAVTPFAESFIGKEPRALLLTMLGAVFFVLLIACVNVANLLLGRASLRSKEVGIRAAVGASRGRIIAQFLVEPMAMAILGAVLGTGLAWVGITLFDRAVADTSPPYWLRFTLDGPIILFVVGLTVFTALASGVLPALRASGSSMNEVLKDDSRGTSSARMGRLSRGLVIFEIALSCGLLVAAGLMIKSVANLRTIDFGFAPEQVFTARLGLPEATYPDSAAQLQFFRELDRRLRAIPEVRSVTLADALPGLYSPWSGFMVQGATYAQPKDYPSGPAPTITPGYFATFGTAVRQGRDFTEQDREGSLPVAMVNQAFVRKHFPDGEALGRQIRMGGADSEAPWRTIVGIAPDLHVTGVENENPEAIYLPMEQNARRFVSIAATGRGDPLQLTEAVRAAVASVDADIPIYFVDTLAGRVAQSTWFYKVFGSLFMIMGFVALFLAGIGLYGVMAFSVSRRTREMGVRMALGASGRDVLGLVMRQGALQLALGLTVGIAMAAGLSQLLATVLFQVQPRDPVIFGSIVFVLAAVGAAASWVPAQRATRVDPMEALRYE